MSKGMRLSKRRLLSCKRPSDSSFGGGASLLACFGAPFTLFLTSACHSLSFNQFYMERILKFNNTLSLTLSWIIRGVGGVTSDLHLTGLRPTENPLPQGRGRAKDIHASESCSPLLLQFYMERVPKAGEGIINLKPAHTKISKLRTAQRTVMLNSRQKFITNAIFLRPIKAYFSILPINNSDIMLISSRNKFGMTRLLGASDVQTNTFTSPQPSPVRRGSDACDVQSNASYAKKLKTIIHFPLSIFHLQRRCA